MQAVWEDLQDTVFSPQSVPTPYGPGPNNTRLTDATQVAVVGAAGVMRWLDELRPATCIYVGDGGGDFCPATKLRPGDTLLARRAPHDGLLRKCRAAKPKLSARVVEWGGSKDSAAEALCKAARAICGAAGGSLWRPSHSTLASLPFLVTAPLYVGGRPVR